MMYHIQTVSRAYADGVPEGEWRTVHRTTSELGAIRRYVRECRWYYHKNSWSGHVRIVGDDGMLYETDSDEPHPRTLHPGAYSQYDAEARKAALS